MPSNITLDPVKVTTHDFLRAFFKKDDAEIYYMGFSDRDKSFPGYKFHLPLHNYSEANMKLKKHNELYRSACFVVNGGGYKNEEVLESGCCTAQFMEMDDFDMNVQLAIINAFPLTPSIIVKTRKSLHTYWLIKDGDINRFRDIQCKLIDLFRSDVKIKNESRIMRLPGYYHCKEEPIMVEVIHFEPNLLYTQDQIVEALK